MKTNSVPVLRRWIYVLLLAVSLGIIPATAPILAQGAMVRIEPSSATVKVGEDVEVQVLVEDVTGMQGLEIHLVYDTAYLDVIDTNSDKEGINAQLSAFLPPDLVAQNVVDEANGQIDIAIAALGIEAAASGSGAIATITFRGKAAGASPLTFANVVLADSDGNAIAASTQDSQITVTGGGLSPTVGILIGLAVLAGIAGLVFLVTRGRRSR